MPNLAELARWRMQPQPYGAAPPYDQTAMQPGAATDPATQQALGQTATSYGLPQQTGQWGTPATQAAPQMETTPYGNNVPAPPGRPMPPRIPTPYIPPETNEGPQQQGPMGRGGGFGNGYGQGGGLKDEDGQVTPYERQQMLPPSSPTSPAWDMNAEYGAASLKKPWWMSVGF